MLKALVIALPMLLSSAAFGAEQTNAPAPATVSTNARPDITTRSGVTYLRCKVTRVDPNGINVFHSKGIAKIPFTDLPDQYQEKYGYDPERAAAYQEAVQEKRAAAAAARNRNALEAQAQESREAGFSDGYLVGKTDAWEGRARDGMKAKRLGKIHGESHRGDGEEYAKGYHEGYNQGWHAAKGAGAPVN